MGNGKITLDDFKEMDQATRDYHVWSKLQIIENLKDQFAGKWVEKVVLFIGMGVGGAIIAALMNIVVASN